MKILNGFDIKDIVETIINTFCLDKQNVYNSLQHMIQLPYKHNNSTQEIEKIFIGNIKLTNHCHIVVLKGKFHDKIEVGQCCWQSQSNSIFCKTHSRMISLQKKKDANYRPDFGYVTEYFDQIQLVEGQSDTDDEEGLELTSAMQQFKTVHGVICYFDLCTKKLYKKTDTGFCYLGEVCD
jgi:hypothetical protein